jgi:hypothetical protein
MTIGVCDGPCNPRATCLRFGVSVIEPFYNFSIRGTWFAGFGAILAR